MKLLRASTGLVLALAALGARATQSESGSPVGTPPAGLKAPPFYAKYVDASGLPVLSSAKTSDEALLAAKEIVDRMLARRPDVRRALGQIGVRIAVMAKSEKTTDIPEHSGLEPKEHWNKRARGIGATLERPVCSCAEENLLGLPDDRYRGESILIHEFAHTMALGLARVDKGFDQRLLGLYQEAVEKKGLWKSTYAGSNSREYWAEGVQSFFDANLQTSPPDGVHNHVNTREELEGYDPALARLIAEVFRDDPWRWTPVGAHKEKRRAGSR